MTDHSDAWRGAVQVRNCLIHVAVDGPHKAPRLMLSNSLGSDLTMWDPQLAAFSKRFRVIRYDSRGHGKSDAPQGPYTIERPGLDAVSVLDRLQRRAGVACRWGEWLANGSAPMHPLASTN